MKTPTLRIVTPNHAISPSNIDEFERARDIKLPLEYREFLLNTNGGVPNDVVYPIEGFQLNPFGGLQIFFGVDTGISYASLEVVLDMYAGGIPQGVIPIADNGGGDYVCIDLRRGMSKIVFWDKRPYWSTGLWREEDLYPVADSFSSFLGALRPNPHKTAER